MKIDCHVHPAGITPESGCYLSPRMRRSPAYLFVLQRFGLWRIKDPAERERRYVDILASWVEESELDRAVLLAFDAVFDASGAKNDRRTNVLVTNDYVKTLSDARPDLFLFGASVHPYREDALEELERVAELDAVLVKLLPNSQGFDPADPRNRAYYRRAAELGLPLLFHAGYEHTIPVVDQGFGRPERLRLALDEGATVIVAHAGSAGLTHPRETFGEFLALLEQYPNCYGDDSALTNFWRSRYLFELLRPERLERKYGARIEDPFVRFVHGSDFPIPITPFAFRRRIGAADHLRARKTRNPLQQDVLIKRLVGVPEDCLTRFGELFRSQRSNR